MSKPAFDAGEDVLCVNGFALTRYAGRRLEVWSPDGELVCESHDTGATSEAWLRHVVGCLADAASPDSVQTALATSPPALALARGRSIQQVDCGLRDLLIEIRDENRAAWNEHYPTIPDFDPASAIAAFEREQQLHQLRVIPGHGGQCEALPDLQVGHEVSPIGGDGAAPTVASGNDPAVTGSVSTVGAPTDTCPGDSSGPASGCGGEGSPEGAVPPGPSGEPDSVLETEVMWALRAQQTSEVLAALVTAVLPTIAMVSELAPAAAAVQRQVSALAIRDDVAWLEAFHSSFPSSSVDADSPTPPCGDSAGDPSGRPGASSPLRSRPLDATGSSGDGAGDSPSLEDPPDLSRGCGR